jgi:hypothetical protein
MPSNLHAPLNGCHGVPAAAARRLPGSVAPFRASPNFHTSSGQCSPRATQSFGHNVKKEAAGQPPHSRSRPTWDRVLQAPYRQYCLGERLGNSGATSWNPWPKSVSIGLKKPNKANEACGLVPSPPPLHRTGCPMLPSTTLEATMFSRITA